MKTLKLLPILFIFGCGDNDKGGGGGDDGGGGFPNPPGLGAQIDRMGRPRINKVLNAPLEADETKKTAQKDAYNQAENAAEWGATEVATGVTVVAEFSKALAIFDIVDKGDGTIPDPDGCGNGALYMTPPSQTSYAMLAGVLADDQLYVDTGKGDCTFYLSLEVEAATGGAITHTACGGRTLTQDVIDVSYSLLGAGLNGFDATAGFAPRIKDNAAVHADVDNDTFPFLGDPH